MCVLQKSDTEYVPRLVLGIFVLAAGRASAIILGQIGLANVVADAACIIALDQITPASLHVEPLVFSIFIVAETSHQSTFVGMNAEYLSVGHASFSFLQEKHGQWILSSGAQ
jgi:hypothetical protein